MSSYKKDLGAFGEEKACEFLQENGYEILARNYRSRAGEIDIIAMKDDILVFTEVKTRTSTAFGMPSEAVSYKKQDKYFRTAMHYITETGTRDIAYRFDIIEVVVEKGAVSINHIMDAYRQVRIRFYM
ncbi:MAG TPA: YraN family protein [Candidatus Atribacteria bacterium]|nr:YraN family protein [Candidatus Atribacteria bacterium]